MSLATTSAVGPRGRSLFFGRSEALAASIWIVIPTPQRCRHLFIRTLYNDGY